MNQQADEKTKKNKNTCGCVCCSVAGMVLLFLFVCLSMTYYRYSHKEIRENEATSPYCYAEKGMNYSYCIAYPSSQFEFTISEPDFLDWCEENSWESVEIKSIPSASQDASLSLPVTIVRYCHGKAEHKECFPRLNKCQIDPTGKTDKACFCTLDDGIYYRQGSSFFVLYDRDKQRCYIYWHRRSG